MLVGRGDDDGRQHRGGGQRRDNRPACVARLPGLIAEALTALVTDERLRARLDAGALTISSSTSGTRSGRSRGRPGQHFGKNVQQPTRDPLDR